MFPHCTSEVAKTGRRRISTDEMGRSCQDLAVRSLRNRASPAKMKFENAFGARRGPIIPSSNAKSRILFHALARYCADGRVPNLGVGRNPAVVLPDLAGI